MSILTCFAPLTATLALAPTTSSQQVALPSTVGQGMEQIRVSNKTTQDVFLAFGTSSSVSATIPTAGSSQSVVHVPANDVELLSPPFGTTNLAYIQAAASTGTCYIVQGEGL